MLRPTFLSFETAKNALQVSQQGLNTVGHNISNVNTPGYTRQRVDQVSISSSGYATKFQTYGAQFPGQGAQISGINQIRDPFLDNRYRTEATNYGELGVKSNGLNDIINVLDEIMSDGLSSKFDDLINNLDKFMSDASSKELATVVRTTALQLTQILNQNANDLQGALVGQKADLDTTISNDVNNILEQIAMLNDKIRADNFYGNPSNELNDTRNLLFDQLSEYLDVTISRTPNPDSPNLEYVKITLNGVKDANGNPVTLVDGGDFNKLKLNNGGPADTGPVSVSLVDGISGFNLIDDITATLQKGGIKGYLDIINGDGKDGNFRGIPYYQASLDDYANKIAEMFNKVNSLTDAEAREVSGLPAIDPPLQPGDPGYLGVDKPLFASGNGGPITAGNLTISKEWMDDASYITTTKKPPVTGTDVKTTTTVTAHGTLPNWMKSVKAGDVPIKTGYANYQFEIDTSAPPSSTSGKISVEIEGVVYTGTYNAPNKEIKLTNTDPITGAVTTGLILNTTDVALNRITDTTPDVIMQSETKANAANDNLLVFKSMIKGSNQYDNGFKGNFQEYIVSVQADAGLDKRLNDSMLSASYSVISGLADRRDSISAVSVDEEGINMMTYQNYYNAAARYMTTLDEALGTIIQSMGVVGR